MRRQGATEPVRILLGRNKPTECRTNVPDYLLNLASKYISGTVQRHIYWSRPASANFGSLVFRLRLQDVPTGMNEEAIEA